MRRRDRLSLVSAGYNSPVPSTKNFAPLADTYEQATRECILAKLVADPEAYLARYQAQFGNVLNADDAATLFDDYARNPAKYRVAVHPAATWIRDELFARSLRSNVRDERSLVVFTAGGNAAGKSAALAATKAAQGAQAVFDSTLSNLRHAQQLVQLALDAGKAISVLYVSRPLDEAFHGMLKRAQKQGRVVTINRIIDSHRGAAMTVRALWRRYGKDPDFQFRFVDNSDPVPALGTIDLAAQRDYTQVRKVLDAALDAEYQAGRITRENYNRVAGRNRGQPPAGGQNGPTGGEGPP